MAQKTQAPTSAGGLLAVFVAAILIAGFGYGFVKRGPGDEGPPVTFTVIFEPAARVTSVDILITINGAVKDSVKVRTSPWTSKVFWVAKGETIVLTATQTVSATLSCATNGEVQETTNLPGKVVCVYSRP